MGALRVIRAGLHTTVQDTGRWGFQSQGVPVAGAMDVFAHRLANALVGNERSAATLEVTLIGPELCFENESTIAVSGGQFDLLLDGVSIDGDAPVVVRGGSVLRFGERRRGARAYVAVRGGIDVPIVMGSRSTHVPSRTGGVQGRALVAGDVIPIGPADAMPHSRHRRRAEARSSALDRERAQLRVLPGPQQDLFAGRALTALQSAPYVVLPESNRMGFRLSGPPLPLAAAPDIISEAAPIGAVQVPASRQPILLMADRQTAGGYAKLATVITADLGVAAQLAPGDEVRFAVCTPAEALAALIAQERRILAAEDAQS
jgi:antagonist of KipI